MILKIKQEMKKYRFQGKEEILFLILKDKKLQKI
jgi:hypothetical protein